MIFGVVKEAHHHERRVALTPFAVKRLAQQGHTVLVERDAGKWSRFDDPAFQEAGGQIVYTAEEVYHRADIVARIGELTVGETDVMREGMVLCGFHHLAVKNRSVLDRHQELGTTLLGWEIVRGPEGDLPVLTPMSELAGRMALHLAAHYLEIESGGRGILLGAIPGVAPATVLILGAGTVGGAAARLAVAYGAHTIVIDESIEKLRRVHEGTGGRAVTLIAGESRLERYTALADAVIGAVLIPGGRAPFLVTETMVKEMKPGSVIVDVSIDQGGCVGTSRPTTIEDPVFRAHDVLHYCVPNLTANVARTASRALASASLPYLLELGDSGLAGALRGNPGLARGIYLYKGQAVHPSLGESFQIPVASLAGLLERE